MASADPTPLPGLRERNKQDKLRRILRAAETLFEEQGFEATTARQISRMADIGTGTLFNYVRDKHELLFLVFEAEALALLDEIEAAVVRKRDVVEALMAIFGPFIDSYARHPELSRHFVRELFFRRREDAPGMAALDARLVELVRGVLQRGVAAGRLREDLDPDHAIALIMAQYGFWVQGWLGMERVPHAAVRSGLRRCLALCIDGIGPGRGDRDRRKRR